MINDFFEEIKKYEKEVTMKRNKTTDEKSNIILSEKVMLALKKEIKSQIDEGYNFVTIDEFVDRFVSSSKNFEMWYKAKMKLIEKMKDMGFKELDSMFNPYYTLMTWV